MNGMMLGVRLDGTKVGTKLMTIPQPHLHLQVLILVLDVSAMSSPKQFECVKMNLDTGAALSTFPLNFGSDGAGDGRFHRTASGECIPDGGPWQFQGDDENGLCRCLSGRLTVQRTTKKILFDLTVVS